MTDKLLGMVLAAGFGTRLTPLTDHVPKPLLSVDGATLLERAMSTLARAGCVAVAVNTHHLGHKVADFLAVTKLPVPYEIFPEPEILGTGGALAGARKFLSGSADFLLHNGDVLWDGDIEILVQQHQQSGALATLLLTDWPAINTVGLDDAGAVLSLRGDKTGAARRLTYTGIGVFASRIIDDIGPGFSSLVDPLERAMSTDPGCVQGVVQVGSQWSDVGTLGRYLQALGTDLNTPGPLRAERLVGHGSARRFWRLSSDGWSSVAMQDAPGSEEFTRQVAINTILARKNLGTAAILAVDKTDSALLMEDLGQDDLWSQVMAPSLASADRLRIYEPVIDHLLRLQKVGPEILRAEPLAGDRELGVTDLRWETNYFQQWFLQEYLGWDNSELTSVAKEFIALATAVALQPQVLIHRDFQSRNIILKQSTVHLVDVQGMRRGPLLYDLASLLWDPYVAMEDEVRATLLDRYGAAMCGDGLTVSDIRVMFLTAALQRLMQALGAFACLGLSKGKAGFLEHIPRAVTNLQRVLRSYSEIMVGANELFPGPLPGLTTLVDRAALECSHEVTDE